MTPSEVSIIQKSAQCEKFATSDLTVRSQRTVTANFPTFLFRWVVEIILFPSNFEKGVLGMAGVGVVLNLRKCVCFVCAL